MLAFLIISIFGNIVSPFSSVDAYRTQINSEGKTESEGSISTLVAGICGQDYSLVTPESADIWEINITITSELSTQPVHIRIYEVIGEYPYNYEEQTDVPYARGTGTANLVVLLNTSKIYEIWIRDAYAKQFTGTIRENWHPYVLNGDFETGRGFPVYGWTKQGHIGRGSSETTYEESTVVGLQQESYTSFMSQDTILDRDDLVFSFWFRPYPEDTTITFQALFDGITIFEDSFSGRYFDYEWRQVIIFLEPLFEIHGLEIGDHIIEFRVPASDLPHAWVEIDEVAIEKVSGFEKIGVEVWCETDTNYIDTGDSIEITGQVTVQTNNIVSLSGLDIEIDYSINEGITWWHLTIASLDQNNEFQYNWTPLNPGEYIIRTLALETDYFQEFEAWTEPLIVGTTISIDSYQVSDSRCDVDSSQYVMFHARYVHDESDAENILVVVNGTEYITDESGWAKVYATEDSIGKSVWIVESVTNVDSYDIRIDEPTIVWDEIELTIETPQRLSVDSDAVEWSGKYLYNDEYYDGSLILNDTLSKVDVGRYSYRVMGVVDTKYGLDKFKANTFDIIFDKVALNVSVADKRIDISELPEITVNGVYEYDNQIFLGSVRPIQDFRENLVGEYPIIISGVNDPLYGLTSFTQNDVSFILDRVIVELNLADDRIDVGEEPDVSCTAYYEFDTQPFIGDISLITSDSIEEIGDFTYSVEGIEDAQYSLSTFVSEEVMCIWDRVKIIEGGVSNEETIVKAAETVWFKAEYEYDSDSFDSSDGILYLNNEPMEWASSTQRWEKEYSSDSPETMTFQITGIIDDTHELTTYNDVAGPLSIEWKQAGIPGFPHQSILIGLVMVILMLYKFKNEKQSDTSREIVNIKRAHAVRKKETEKF